MNERGTYGTPLIPLYCRDDSGLPPVPAVLLDSRGIYGQHSFHGHEAPIYGSGDYARVDHATHWGLSWKPRLEIVGHRRGTYGPRVGEMSTTQAMLMSPAAISAELARIDQAMHAFDVDLSKAAHAVAQAHGYPTLELTPGTSAADQKQAVADYLKALAKATSVRKPPLETAAIFALYQQQWIPFFADGWQPFYAEERGGSWWHNAAYDGEKYLAQLIQLRKRAKDLGVKLLSPDPAEEHDGESWASLAKWGLIGGGVIGGVWALSKIISSVRSR